MASNDRNRRVPRKRILEWCSAYCSHTLDHESGAFFSWVAKVGGADHVALLESDRDGLHLDRCRLVVPTPATLSIEGGEKSSQIPFGHKESVRNKLKPTPGSTWFC